MTEPTLWNQLLIWPMLNMLIGFYKAFVLVGLPSAFGFAIIAVTLIIRGGLAPLTKKQMASAKKMSALKPKIDLLNQKYKDDKMKLQQATMQLYKDSGVNPAAGCLPLLVQMPLLFALFSVFRNLFSNGVGEGTVEMLNSILYHSSLHIKALDVTFFGIDLSLRPNQWQEIGVVFLLVPVITGGLQFFQTRLMMGKQQSQKKKEKEGEKKEDMAADMQKQMSIIMPVFLGWLALSFPLGLSLYWNTYTVFGILQQLQVNKKTL